MVADRRVVPAQRLSDAFAPPADMRQAFARTDHASRTVVAKMSSWPQAQNAAYLAATLRACGAVAAVLGCP